MKTDDFLDKPVMPEVLIGRVEKLLTKKGGSQLNHQANILVVDDEMGIREACKRALAEEGYAIDLAEDGTIGLQKVKEKSYDLILMDLMMPGIGGLDLIKKVHDIDPEIIVVVITGYATIETAVEATKRGAYDYSAETVHPGDAGGPRQERAGETGAPARGPETSP